MILLAFRGFLVVRRGLHNFSELGFVGRPAAAAGGHLSVAGVLQRFQQREVYRSHHREVFQDAGGPDQCSEHYVHHSFQMKIIVKTKIF